MKAALNRDTLSTAKTFPLSENRVWGSQFGTFSCTRTTWSQTQCSRPEIDTTPTTTASGVHNYGFRFYDPVTGRWRSRDPIGHRGGLNVYSFVQNDAIGRWDVLGREPQGSSAANPGQQSEYDLAPLRVLSDKKRLVGVAPLKAQKGKFQSKDCVIFSFNITKFEGADFTVQHTDQTLVTKEGKVVRQEKWLGDGDALKAKGHRLLPLHEVTEKNSLEWYACCCQSEDDNRKFKIALERVNLIPEKFVAPYQVSCAAYASYHAAGIRGVADLTETGPPPEALQGPGGRKLDPGHEPMHILYNMVTTKCDFLWRLDERTLGAYRSQQQKAGK